MELGLLVSGGGAPTRLADHLDGLVANSVLQTWKP